MNKEDILLELSKAVRYKLINNSAFCVCPFHIDHDPSLGVNLVKKVTKRGVVPVGYFHCLGCGQKGTWNDLAEKLGLASFKGEKSEDSKVRVSEKVVIFSPEMEEDLDLSPITDKWKRYSPKFLKRFGAKKVWVDKYEDYYLYLPVYNLGAYVGHIRAKMDKESEGFKYWFNLEEKIFYPLEYYMNRDLGNTIVLVEGVADAFRLIKNGIPALATLGTRFVIENGIEYLDSLMIENVILAYDGDDAGKTAMLGGVSSSGIKEEGLASILTKSNFNVRVFLCPDEEDPDSMPFIYVKAIKRLFLSLGGNLL